MFFLGEMERVLARADAVQRVDEPASARAEEFELVAQLVERASVDAAVAEIEPVERCEIHRPARVLAARGDEVLGRERVEQDLAFSFAEAVVVAGVAERAKRATVHDADHGVGELHFVLPAARRVVPLVVSPLQPLRVEAGMEQRVVADLVSGGGDGAPRGNLVEESALEMRIKRGAQAVRFEQRRDLGVVARQAVVIAERHDAAALAGNAAEQGIGNHGKSVRDQAEPAPRPAFAAVALRAVPHELARARRAVGGLVDREVETQLAADGGCGADLAPRQGALDRVAVVRDVADDGGEDAGRRRFVLAMHGGRGSRSGTDDAAALTYRSLVDSY